MKAKIEDDNLNFAPKCKTLAESPEGKVFRVAQVPEHSLLAPLGLREGKKLIIKAKQPFSGPIIAEVEGRQIAIDRELAHQIELTDGEDFHATG